MLTKITDNLYVDVDEIAKVEVHQGKENGHFRLHLTYKNKSFGVELVHGLSKEQVDDFLYKIDSHSI